jgi:hypothetical protein
MGVAWLLLKRTFANRPKRTLLFIFGYALATAVMITLLSVGEAVLLQARDKDLLGGGDIILVPQGIDIETLKVGGVGAFYQSIPQSRFIVRQLLGSSRFQHEIAAVSPYLFSKLVYLRRSSDPSSPVETVYADGSLPDQEKTIRGIRLPWHNQPEDTEWLHPGLENFYHSIDHFHLPTISSPALDQWAEWHYFNFEGKQFYGYLSLMVAGNVLEENADWIVSLQLFDRTYHQYAFVQPASRKELPLLRIDYRIGANAVRFVKNHYEIELNFGNRPVRGKLSFFPNPRLYFPPAVLAKSSNFESGYVIAALRGKYKGSLEVEGKHYDMDGVEGYHDHNWGIWQQPGESGVGQPVHWNWGHAYSDEYSIFYGEIFLNGKSRGLFCGVFDQMGFLTLFRPDRIVYSDYRLNENGLSIPRRLNFSQQKPFTAIQLQGSEVSSTASPVGKNGTLNFVQYKMEYSVILTIDGKQITFPAHGNAETFVSKSTKKS